MKAESGRRSDGRETALDSEVEAIKDGGVFVSQHLSWAFLGFVQLEGK